jgi:hypothetical protein
MKSLSHRHLSGHYPGHWRDAFLEALELYGNWETGEPEPTVEMELNYQPVRIPISRVFGKLWHCSDILPSLAVSELEGYGLELKSRTYAAAARTLLSIIKEERSRP